MLYPLLGVALAAWLAGPLEGLFSGWGAPVAPRGAWGWWLARVAAALGGLGVAGGLLIWRWRVRRRLARHEEEARRERAAGGESD